MRLLEIGEEEGTKLGRALAWVSSALRGFEESLKSLTRGGTSWYESLFVLSG